MNLDLPHIMQDLAALQDIIWWDNFAMGIVSKKLLQIQSAHLSQCNSGRTAKKWISGFITQLLQVTHSQWIYRCVLGSGARSDHGDIDRGPQGRVAERDRPPVSTRTRKIGRGKQVLARMQLWGYGLGKRRAAGVLVTGYSSSPGDRWPARG